MKAEIKTKRFIGCPHCGRGDHWIDHLFNGATFGPWLCKHCNHSFSGKILADGVEITEVQEYNREPVLCLFRFRDLYFVIRSYSKPKDADPRWYDYLFHSHQCPVNLLRNVEEVFCPSEGLDPHGILRFIAAIPDPGDLRHKYDRDHPTLESIFHLFGTDGTEAPTEWPESQRGLLPGIARLQDAHRKSTSAKA